MKINSKRKGNIFELEVSKILTAATDSKWFRVGVSSGGRATREGITDPRFNGDVFTEDKQYEDIVIECKSYAALDITELYNEKSKFFGWINQAITESKQKKWMLFIKIKNRGVFLVLTDFGILLRIFGNSNVILPISIMINNDSNKYFLYKLKGLK